MTKLHHISLETFAGGAAPERFEHELKKVIANVMDPNTDPEKVRKISLEFKFAPNEGRTGIRMELATKVSLAPIRPIDTIAHIGEQDGKLTLVGYDPSQPSLFEEDQDPDVNPVRAHAPHTQEE